MIEIKIELKSLPDSRSIKTMKKNKPIRLIVAIKHYC